MLIFQLNRDQKVQHRKGLENISLKVDHHVDLLFAVAWRSITLVSPFPIEQGTSKSTLVP